MADNRATDELGYELVANERASKERELRKFEVNTMSDSQPG